jgi:hypothetical protein
LTLLEHGADPNAVDEVCLWNVFTKRIHVSN